MLVRLLGSVDVVVEGAVCEVPGRRRRAVLATLALDPGRVVSVERLMDVVWGDQAPTIQPKTVQRHISQVRAGLGEGAAIVSYPTGFLLDLDKGATDVQIVEDLMRDARRTSDPVACVAACRAALGLWRGRPLADVVGFSWLDQQAERLESLRWEAVRALMAGRLALGEHAVVASELEVMVSQRPFDEVLQKYLVLALAAHGAA